MGAAVLCLADRLLEQVRGIQGGVLNDIEGGTTPVVRRTQGVANAAKNNNLQTPGASKNEASGVYYSFRRPAGMPAFPGQSML